MDKLLCLTKFSHLAQWDVKHFFKIKVNSKYPVEKLGRHLVHQTSKVQLSNFGTTKVGILGVSNKLGMFDADYLEGNKVSQKYHTVKENWLAYNPYRINVGSIGLRTKQQTGEYISPAYVVFSCKETMLPEYMYLLAKSKKFNVLIRNATTGTVRQTLHFENLAEISAPVPPISEQRKILDEYHKLIEKGNKQANIVIELENKINDYITETVGFKSINKSDSRNCLITEYRLSELSRWDVWTDKEKIVSNKYPIVHLKDLIIGNPFYGANEKAIKCKGDVRYIRITDINEDGSLGEDFVTVANVDKKYLLSQNDFLIARSGNTVGKTFLYDDTMGKAIFAGYLIKFVLNQNKVLPKYMLYYTKSTAFKKWIASNQRISGQPNINGQEYLTADIILPPINVQKQIVEKIEELRKEKTSAEQLRDKYACRAVEYFEKAVFTE